MNDSAQKTITRTAHTEWKGDLRAEIRVRDCAPFYSDEPKGRGGLFEHPTPAEYTIGALTGCSAAHVEMFAKEASLPLEGCRVEGRLTMGHFPEEDERSRNGGVVEISLDIEVTSPGTEAQFEKVKALFREQCVLYRFARAAAPVKDVWTLVRPN
ncbi:MAG: OsmC family protein [bacterium]